MGISLSGESSSAIASTVFVAMKAGGKGDAASAMPYAPAESIGPMLPPRA